MRTFTVIDAITGETPDLEWIAVHESWAKELVHCDMSGFALTEDGCLILLDDCGNWRSCPQGRFKVTEEAE